MKKNKKLIWRLYPSFLLVTLISLLSVTGYTVNSIRQFFLEQNRKDLVVQARLLENQLKPAILSGDMNEVDRLSKHFSPDVNTRITVILPDGKVVGDTKENPRYMDNHIKRPEIKTALSNSIGYSVRYSGTLQQEMMYVAIPLLDHKVITAIIRTSVSTTSIDEELSLIQIDRIIWGVITALIASIICLIISRKISQPIEEMKTGAQRFAKGDLRYRLALPEISEFSSLACSMNQMASDLESRIVTIVNQRNEYEAVLSSMVEGVMAIDQDEKIINVNQAAAKMLNISSEDLKHRSIQEMVRNSQMQEYISDTLTTGKTNIGDIIVYRDTDVVFNFRSMPLFDTDENQLGALAVINDVTRLRLLENMRQDFVANVSHELKTPLTAIKGFVETLIHSPMSDDPEESNRFLKIIAKHVDRLNMIIEDLLSLARIEKLGDDESGITISMHDVKSAVESAVQVIQVMAEKKKIAIEFNKNDSTKAKFDPALIEQAIVNLMENAIKYSDDESTIKVNFGEKDDQIFIKVVDNGPGIHSRHFPRLFERFYRADKARSRDLGGTGLGLAIVKHIVQLHSGRVTVDSVLGKGSTFTLYLPKS